MSWYELLDIMKEQKAEFDFYASRPPEACPNDGTPLKQGPGGPAVLFCPFDGWQYPRDWVRPMRL